MTDKAICPVCLKLAKVRVDGTLNRHGYRNNTREQADHKQRSCSGSGKTPEAAKSVCTLA
jgi:hypothetical protein